MALEKTITAKRGTLGSTVALLFTVASGWVCEIREIRLVNKSANKTDAYIAVGTSTSANTQIYRGALDAASSGLEGTATSSARITVPAGESVYGWAAQANNVDYYISYVLVKP